MRQGTRESPAQLWGGSVVRAYDGSVRLHSILLHSSHIVRALSRWYEVCLTTSTQEETTEHCPVYPTSGQKDFRKLLVLGCFLAVFPKRQKDLASLTYPSASVLYGSHAIVLR